MSDGDGCWSEQRQQQPPPRSPIADPREDPEKERPLQASPSPEVPAAGAW